MFKVILNSYLILKKMNERITVNISTNIHNELIKTKYIPSYIFENEGKIFKKLKKTGSFFKKAEIAEVKRVSGNFTMIKY